MRKLLVLLISLPLAVACSDNAVTAPASSDLRIGWPQRIDLGTLGGASSFANDINHHGTVVGSADNAAGLRRAFRWTALSGMKDLGTLPGDDWSEAFSILDDGRILGVSGSSNVDMVRGTSVMWSSDGAITALPIPLLPDATFGMASGFNERGDVVGWDICDAGPCVGFTAQHAWFWSAARGKYDITASFPGWGPEGVASDVDGSGLVLGTNDANTACWRVRVHDCWRPFLWSHETGYRELGTPWVGDTTAAATAFALIEGPTFVGRASSIALGEHPYVWTQGAGFRLLQTVAGGYATSINRQGTAVGAAWHPELPAYQATAWRRSGGPIRLSPKDRNPQIALAVNDMGVVAGWSAQSGGGNHATLWLLGPASPALVALASRDAEKPAAPAPTLSARAAAAGAAATACLSDTDALVSRGALFACVARAR